MVRVANAKKVDWRQLQNGGANLAKMVEYHAGNLFPFTYCNSGADNATILIQCGKKC